MRTNSFKQTRSPGWLDLNTNPNPSVQTCVYIGEDSTDRLFPGDSVMLRDYGPNEPQAIAPLVSRRANDTDPIEGLAVLDVKKAIKESTDPCTIAKKGAVILMNAIGPIPRGSRVMPIRGNVPYVRIFDPAVEPVGTYALGKVLDRANVRGQVIRVEILAEGV